MVVAQSWWNYILGLFLSQRGNWFPVTKLIIYNNHIRRLKSFLNRWVSEVYAENRSWWHRKTSISNPLFHVEVPQFLRKTGVFLYFRIFVILNTDYYSYFGILEIYISIGTIWHKNSTTSHQRIFQLDQVTGAAKIYLLHMIIIDCVYMTPYYCIYQIWYLKLNFCSSASR